MINYPNLLQILHINGLNEKSSQDEVDVVFKALGYSPEDRNEAIQILRTNGWLGEQKIEIKSIPENQSGETVVNPIPFVNVAPIAPVSQVLETPPNKSVKVAMVSIMILILLAGATVTFAYIQKIGPFKPIAVENLPITSTQEVASTTSVDGAITPIIDTNTTSSSTTEVTIPTNTNNSTNKVTTPSSNKITQTNKTIKNCGSLLGTHLWKTEPRTNGDTVALKCMSDAILTCSPATLTITGSDGGSYEVYGNNGANCTIGSTTSAGKNKCDIPNSMISELQTYAIKNSQPIEDILSPISFALAFKGGTDTATGKPFSLSCEK